MFYIECVGDVMQIIQKKDIIIYLYQKRNYGT